MPVRCRSRVLFQAVKHQPQFLQGDRKPFSNAASAPGLGSCCHSSPRLSQHSLVLLQKPVAAGMLSGQGLLWLYPESRVCPGQESAADGGRNRTCSSRALADSSPSVFHLQKTLPSKVTSSLVTLSDLRSSFYRGQKSSGL